MRGTVKQLERKFGRLGPRPFAHLSDDEVLEALRRTAEGRPSGVTLYPDPERARQFIPPHIRAMSDDQLKARLQEVAARLRGGK
ncbi:MAG: hypothetical protein O7H39_08895 [Gammaproteobacteria bacterium]|nr:hypothetical protein [Gammaproteobacteria bacterium]